MPFSPCLEKSVDELGSNAGESVDNVASQVGRKTIHRFYR